MVSVACQIMLVLSSYFCFSVWNGIKMVPLFLRNQVSLCGIFFWVWNFWFLSEKSSFCWLASGYASHQFVVTSHLSLVISVCTLCDCEQTDIAVRHPKESLGKKFPNLVFPLENSKLCAAHLLRPPPPAPHPFPFSWIERRIGNTKGRDSGLRAIYWK